MPLWVSIHPEDARQASLTPDLILESGLQTPLDKAALDVVHLPGHTPRSIRLHLFESGSFQKVVVGDASFPSSPGRTATPEVLQLSLEALERTAFTWPDATELNPGHGVHTDFGAERAAFEAFRARSLPLGLPVRRHDLEVSFSYDLPAHTLYRRTHSSPLR